MKKVSPYAVATAAMIAGCGLLLAGIYLLAGLGWALIGGSGPLLLLGAAIIRGLSSAE